MSIYVRQLQVGDEAAFRALRLDGLKSDPEAFGSNLAAEEAWTLERYAKTLANNHAVGAFLDDTLVGTAGWFRFDGNSAHRGHVWGVVVASQHRGRGVGRAVIDAIIDNAAKSVSQLHLGVGAYNTGAIALYSSAGFEIYGTEPRALYVNGRYIDEHLMVRFLDRDTVQQQGTDRK